MILSSKPKRRLHHADSRYLTDAALYPTDQPPLGKSFIDPAAGARM